MSGRASCINTEREWTLKRKKTKWNVEWNGSKLSHSLSNSYTLSVREEEKTVEREVHTRGELNTLSASQSVMSTLWLVQVNSDSSSNKGNESARSVETLPSTLYLHIFWVRSRYIYIQPASLHATTHRGRGGITHHSTTKAYRLFEWERRKKKNKTRGQASPVWRGLFYCLSLSLSHARTRLRMCMSVAQQLVVVYVFSL